MIKWTKYALAALVCGLAASAQAADIFYYANPDPTTVDGSVVPGFQPWIRDGSIAQSSGVTDGTNLAWDVNNTTAGQYEFWKTTPLPAYIAEGNAKGWTYTVRLRLPNLGDAVGGGVETGYYTGTKAWDMAFGTEADGDPIVFLFDNATNPTFTLQGASNTEYHVYSLKYDPVSTTADLFIDGVERISNYTGFTNPNMFILWGDTAVGDTGRGLWNLVEWTAPEPSSAALVTMGIGVLALRRRNRA